MAHDWVNHPIFEKWDFNPWPRDSEFSHPNDAFEQGWNFSREDQGCSIAIFPGKKTKISHKLDHGIPFTKKSAIEIHSIIICHGYPLVKRTVCELENHHLSKINQHYSWAFKTIPELNNNQHISELNYQRVNAMNHWVSGCFNWFSSPADPWMHLSGCRSLLVVPANFYVCWFNTKPLTSPTIVSN